MMTLIGAIFVVLAFLIAAGIIQMMVMRPSALTIGCLAIPLMLLAFAFVIIGGVFLTA